MSAIAIRQSVQNAVTKLQNTKPQAANPLLLFKSRSQGAEWQLGLESRVVNGAEALLLPESAQIGYVAFSESEDRLSNPPPGYLGDQFLGEMMVPLFSDNIIDPTGLKSMPNAVLNPQISVLCYLPKFETQALLKGNSQGFYTAVHGLLEKDVIPHIRNNPDSPYFNPCVRLDLDSYQHKKRGRITIPKLTFIAWQDTNGRTDRA